MNKDRRKRLEAIKGRLTDLIEELEFLRDEEQESYDNLPESLQEGEQGQKMYDAIDNLENAVSSVEEAETYIDEAML